MLIIPNILEKNYCKSEDKSDGLNILRRLRDPDVYKPLIIVNLFFMLQVWTGNGPQQWFMINIMKATGTRLDPVLCTLMVSVTNVIGQAMAVVASLRWDRRPVFIR